MANEKTYNSERRKFKKKIKSWGMPDADVERCMRQVKERQFQKKMSQIPPDAPMCTLAVYKEYLNRRIRPQDRASAAIFQLGNDYEPPSDKGYKPNPPDSVLTGVARATGETAKAVKRRKTITKYEYDERNGRKA